jgi:hypothetical protein
MAITLDNSASAMRTALGYGTSATKDVGTSAGQVLQLDGSGDLPALNAENITTAPSGYRMDNSPYFSGYVSQNTSVTSASTWGYESSAINFTKEYDPDGYYNLTNGRFTPQVAGYYFITASLHGDCGGANFQYSNLWIYKNTNVLHVTEQHEMSANANEHSSTATAIVQLNGSTDYLRVVGQISDSSGNPVLYGGVSGQYIARMNSINIFRLAV